MDCGRVASSLQQVMPSLILMHYKQHVTLKRKLFVFIELHFTEHLFKQLKQRLTQLSHDMI